MPKAIFSDRGTNFTSKLFRYFELKDSEHSNWEDVLDDVLFAYRSSVHSSTLDTPYFLLHGRHHNIPINEFLDASPKTFKSASDYVGNLADRLRYSFQRVREESEKPRTRQREQ
ncbi:Uncharacterized protein APZ42_000877 [Daphnia magna]|uniref:Integrase catalytic domain-containing protein n=1 Tax=Daphnia magna TaxID=35525 RepID=A0A164JBH2_9CRUS|nr:Uncharacterized protein APZ42_000877 [Daphnia magna]